MNKTLVFFTLNFICLFLQAQPLTEAMRLYEAANALTPCLPQRYEQLTQAVALLENEPFAAEQLLLRAALAAEINCNDQAAGLKACLDVIAQAKTELNTDDHPFLLEAYLVFVKLNKRQNPEMSLYYGTVAMKYIKKPSKKYFTLMRNLQQIYTRQRNNAKIEFYLAEAETLLDQSKDKELPSLWITYYTLKVSYYISTGNYEQVIIYANKALAENKNHNTLSLLEKQDMYMWLAESNARLKNKSESATWLKRYTESENPDTLDNKSAAHYFHIIGSTHTLLNDFEPAIHYLEQALARLELEATNNPSKIQVVYTIALCHAELKNWLTSENYMEKVLEYQYVPYYAQFYNHILWNLGKHEEGLKNIEKSLMILIEGFAPTSIYDNPSSDAKCSNNQLLISILTYKSLFLQGLSAKKSPLDINLMQKSLETAELTFTFYERINTAELYELSQHNQKRIYYDPITLVAYSSAAEIYKQSPTTSNLKNLFGYVEKSKSLLLSQAIAAEQLPEAIATQKDDLIRNVRTLQQKVTLNPNNADYINQLHANSVRLEELMQNIKQEYPQTLSLNNTPTVSLQNLVSSLDAETALVYVFSSRTSLYLLTIDARQPLLHQQAIAPTFKQEIQDFITSIKNPLLVQEAYRNSFIDQSHALYQKLIAPIAANLAGKKRVIFIADELTAQLPFEVLLPTNKKKPYHELDFLIKNFDISYQYSGTIYHYLQQKTPILDKSLLAFAPVFENEKAAETAQRSLTTLFPDDQTEELIQLPKSETEVKTIAQTVKKQGGEAKVLLKADALKSNLQKELYATPHQFVHIATHGVVNFDDPKFSAVVCHETKGNIEDNFFFVNEVQMQPIAADLVVLSSCESGIGRSTSSEGLLALNRSFIYAGANNVMFSLWKVSDKQTADLMIDFYRFYFEENNYTAALRLAKLNMLKDPISANPRYWAAFLLMGR